MTKEEKIKEAWGGSCGGEIDENGWKPTKGAFIPGTLQVDVSISGDFYRPKSLQGIENNNGWKSINENLPKEKGYYIMYNGENMVLIELNDTTNMITLREQFLKDGFTHYQPIEKPKPPMY